MDDSLNEIRRNLCIAGQFDLAGALGPKSIPARDMAQVLEYSRVLIAINSSRSLFGARIRAEILAGLWGYAASRDDGEYLRIRILVAVEQLVRECSDMESIHAELLVLAIAHEVSYGRSHDLHELSRLVYRGDFNGLVRALSGICPSTKSYTQVFGRAYHYHKTGNMDGIDYDQVLREVTYP